MRVPQGPRRPQVTQGPQDAGADGEGEAPRRPGRGEKPRRMPRERSSGGGAGGILAMVGVLILLNVLSQVFDWGYYFY